MTRTNPKVLFLLFISPFKFRHGHAIYALKMAKDIPALKAVSQNLMHSNISITDGIYGILSDNDVRGQIAALGQINTNENKNIGEMIITTKRFLRELEAKQFKDD